MMEKGYRHIVFFFVLILLLVPFGFRRYFGHFPEFADTVLITHIHAVAMFVWCMVLIVQPILIQSRKIVLHKKIGRFSYILVPCVVVTMFGVALNSFELMRGQIAMSENIANLFFPISQITLFAVFYTLAIINKRNTSSHMRYIITSSVTLFGPTIGRLPFNTVGLTGYNWDLIFMDVVLLIFIFIDWRNGRGAVPYIVGLVAFVTVHLLFNADFGSSAVWRKFIGAILT